MKVFEAIVWNVLTVMIFAFAVNCELIAFEDFIEPDGPWGRQPILVDDGGYHNLLVAIHNDVQEAPGMLERIKETFKRTSNLLHHVTNQTFYLKEISILVPSHWYNSSDYEEPRPNETIRTARIVVRNVSSEGAPPTTPFVRHPVGYGEGEYIYLPEDVLTTGNDSAQNDSAKVILHLWGRLLGEMFITLNQSRDGSWSLERDSSTRNEKVLTNDSNSDGATPIFRILQQRDKLSVVILDARENMQDNNKHERMMDKYKFYSWHLFPTYSWLGVVEMKTTPRKVIPCLKIWESSGFRWRTFQNLSKDASGASSLGNAVKKAIKMLYSVRDDISGSNIFIMSDGTDVINPNLDSVLSDVISSGVTLSSLPFSANASENIALNNTINMNFPVSVEDTLYRLEDSDKYDRVFVLDRFELMRGDWDDFHVKPTLRLNEDLPDQQFLMRVRAEQLPALNCSFYTDYDALSHITFYEQYINIEDVIISDKIFGGLECYSSISQNISLEVFTFIMNPSKSYKGKNIEMVQAQAFLEYPIFNYTSLGGNISLFASVTKNEWPVAGAVVKALVSNLDGNIIEVELHDQGLGADDEMADGIYSAFLHQYISVTEGNYSFKVHVSSSKNSCLATEVISGSLDSNTSCDTLDPFQRYTYSKTFTIIGIPPSVISDVTVEMIDDRTVRLNWTAPGEDLMIGRASRYELRYSYDSTTLIHYFQHAELVKENSLLSGIMLDPKASTLAESVNLSFNKNIDAVLFLAIRAFDGEGNAGQISKVVSVAFYEIKEESTKVTSTISLKSEETISFADKIKDVMQTKQFLASSIICGLLAIIILLAILKYVRKKRNGRNFYMHQARVSPVMLHRDNQNTPESEVIIIEDI